MWKKIRNRIVLLVWSLWALPALAVGDELAVYHEPSEGFMFKYPAGWSFYADFAHGSKATAHSLSGAARLTVRVTRYQYQGFRDGEELFIEKYKRGTAAESHQFPGFHYHSFENSISTYTFAVDTKVDHVDHEYRYRVLIFPEYDAVVALETLCVPQQSARECAALDKAQRSFWIYNQNKFSQIFKSAFEAKKSAVPENRRFGYERTNIFDR